MPIYDKPVRALMRDMVIAMRLQKGQIVSRDQVLGWFRENYPLIKRGTVTAHLILLATNAPSRVHHSAKPDDDLFFQIDPSHFRLFDATVDPAPIYPGQINSDGALLRPTSLSEPEPPAEFAYESDLRDFLAKNLHLIEPGLRLYRDEGITGVEFPAGGRFIDILAVDSANGYVVIELKVSKGYDRVVGQLLRYMAWVGENHAEAGQRVRGVIVAREISSDLVLACSMVSDIELVEYELSVKLRRVSSREV